MTIVQSPYNNSIVNDHTMITLQFNDYGSTFKRILENLCDGLTIKQQFEDYDTIIIEDYDILLPRDKHLVDKIISELSEKNIVYC